MVNASNDGYSTMFFSSLTRNPHDPMREVAEYLRGLNHEQAAIANKEIRRIAFTYFSEKGNQQMIERYDLTEDGQ